MKIELGGGLNPRGEGFINLDRKTPADIITDFELAQLPFADDSVIEVYSAHCLEHVSNLVGILADILRVCTVGAPVELRFPYWLQSMAMCYDHKHTISAEQVAIWCDHPQWDFHTSRKRFVLRSTNYIRGNAYSELRPLFPMMNDEQVAKYIPNCCHEVRFYLNVVER